jgi:phosphoserine phosphatase
MLHSTEKVPLVERSLVVFDFDGTLTTVKHRSSWQSVHEYFNTWESYGQAALNLFSEGKISYYDFCKADAYPWINRSEEEYQRALDTIELREGISEVVDFFKQKKCILAIISMGLSDVVEKVAQEFEFDFWIANELIRKNNRITGEVKINVEMGEKGKMVSDLLNKYNLSLLNSIAVGDASADISMFEAVHTSIAIEPSSEQVANSAKLVCKTNNLAEIISFFIEE